MGYLTSMNACKVTGKSAPTLRKWADDGRIPSIRTEGGQRLYDVQACQLIAGERSSGPRVFIYCRGTEEKRQRNAKDLIALQDAFFTMYEDDDVSVTELVRMLSDASTTPGSKIVVNSKEDIPLRFRAYLEGLCNLGTVSIEYLQTEPVDIDRMKQEFVELFHLL